MIRGKSHIFKGPIRGRIMHWPMNEATGNPGDRISGQTATRQGDASWTTNGGLPCIDFDGSGDYLQVAASSVVEQIGASSFTFLTWVYPDSAALTQGMFTVDADANVCQFNLTAAAKMTVFARDNSANTITFTSTGSHTSAEWQQIGLVRNGTTIYIYRNGAVDATSGTNASMGTIVLTGENLYLGCTISGTDTKTNYFDGRMGRTGFWNRALSTAEIAHHYALGRMAS